MLKMAKEIDMPTIEELRAQLREAEDAQRKLGQAEYEAVRKAATFEWRMTRVPFGFTVECRYDEASRQAVADWKAAFPVHGTLNFRDPEQWHGMTYIMGYTKDGNAFLSEGGGSVILKLQNSFGPHPITREQAEMLERGEIPVELRKPW